MTLPYEYALDMGHRFVLYWPYGQYFISHVLYLEHYNFPVNIITYYILFVLMYVYYVLCVVCMHTFHSAHIFIVCNVVQYLRYL